MFRSLFSVGAICSLLFVSIGVPAAKAAGKKCPVEPPSTILSLFKASDAVYLGKFDKTSEGDVVRSDEDSSTVSVSQHFSISSTIKGESRKFFVRTYDDYRYKPAQAEIPETTDAVVQEVPNDEIEEPEFDEEDEGYRPLREGDTVLLFLKYEEPEEGEVVAKNGKRKLELAHYRDGIKRLGESEVASYEARVRELKGILSKKTGNDAALLNWIIRCIDDPVTRWEGAYELQSSFATLDWKERSKKEHADAEAEKTDDAVSEDADGHGEDEVIEDEELDNSVYASLLTEAQKARLMQIAVSSKPADPKEQPRMLFNRDGDQLLFDVVKRWGDTKLASVMLDRLRSSGDNNYDKLIWMTSIAEVLKSDDLTAITEQFGDATYQGDDEAFETEDEAETVTDGPADPKEERTDETKTGSPETETYPPGDEAKAEKKTYKQYRDELLADFFDKASVIISQEKEKAAQAKAK